MTSFRNLRNNGVAALSRPIFGRTLSLLAIAGLVAIAPAFAKDPAEKEAKSNGKGTAVKVPNHETTAIPECLEKLKLSSQQQEQIKGIIGSYDESLASVWTKFGERYMQTIDLESQLLAAVEDNLTETQRQQVRSQRHKTTRHEKAIEGTNTKPNQATSKTANAVDDELAGVGVSLTAEQEAAADTIEEKYRSHLRSLNRDIEGLHAQLLSLAADKLVEVEKVLTKEQLTELRTHRKNAPEAKLAVTKN
jgi:hypothetical protein